MFRHVAKVKINLLIRILIFSDFLILSAVGFVNPIFAIYITGRISGASLSVVGYAATILLVVKSLMQLPIAKYVDRTPGESDEFFFVFWGSILASATTFLYLFIDQVWQLYALQACFGLANAMSYPSWFALFSRHVDKHKEGFEWGIYSSVVGVGVAVTSALGGLMAERFGFGPVFFIVGLISLIGTLMLLPMRRYLLEHDNLKLHDFDGDVKPVELE